MHPQMVFVHVVCCQKVTDSLESSVSGSVPDGMGLGSPRTSCLRLHLDGAKLEKADLDGADLLSATGLAVSQIQSANNWTRALYSQEFLKELDLPPDHSVSVYKQAWRSRKISA